MSALQSSGYWYPQGSEETTPIDLLNLLRRYRSAERKMRAATRDSMGMGETDLLALRFLLKAHQSGRILRQKDFASELEISNASVSALIDRLCRDGYAQRVVHPEDRRSVAIMPTKHTDQEVRETLGPMHQRMLEAVESLTADERTAAAKFLHGMIRSVEKVDTPTTPTTPKAPSSSGTKGAATAHTAS